MQQWDPLLATATQQFPLAPASPAPRTSISACSARAGAGAQQHPDSNVHDEFARGRFVFYISGPWQIGEFRRRLPPERQGDWMTAPLPGPNGPGGSIAGGASLVLFARSAHKDAAWRLVEYLSRPDVQLRFFEASGDLPARRSVWRAPALANDRYAAAFRDQLERAVPPPAVPEWERIAPNASSANAPSRPDRSRQFRATSMPMPTACGAPPLDAGPRRGRR